MPSLIRCGSRQIGSRRRLLLQHWPIAAGGSHNQIALLRLFTGSAVIGPVSSSAICSNGGLALNTCALPTSFSVIHTSSFSGLTAMLGQKGLVCGTRLIILWE